MSSDDRKLDAEVAEKVMEWKHVGMGRSLNPQLIGNPHKGGGLATVPHYSTSIAAAWEVVEKFETFQIEKLWGDYQVRVQKDNNEVVTIVQDTAPLAICKAALQAVRDQKKQTSETDAMFELLRSPATFEHEFFFSPGIQDVPDVIECIATYQKTDESFGNVKREGIEITQLEAYVSGMPIDPEELEPGLTKLIKEEALEQIQSL